ncbi:low-specificity L-threonine aldolase [candidate division KSB1 bacterium]|nr:low-specificity L-threonine aldolase [candidate division KSB1 bacterium]
MEQVIDLRSDTVTQPTPAMRQAMAEAPVGDDVFGEDPTVNELQARIAALCGKEAALFVPSGTMSNQIAINAHTQPGDEVICDYNCHIFNYEGGGAALLSGAQLHPLPGNRGVITAEQIRTAIRPPDHHYAHTRLIELENTHNRAGGAILPLDEIRRIRDLADEFRLAMHLDGARLWNAHIATRISMQEWSAPFDSITLCFSKGLGAPIGSMLVGSVEFIDRAHRYRKMYGGGMRQVGLIAAAALYALDFHLERLADDHRRAYQLARKLVECGAQVDLQATQTNIVIADFQACGPAIEISAELKAQNILALPISADRIRFVTHLNVDDAAIAQTMTALENILL